MEPIRRPPNTYHLRIEFGDQWRQWQLDDRWYDGHGPTFQTIAIVIGLDEYFHSRVVVQFGSPVCGGMHVETIEAFSLNQFNRWDYCISKLFEERNTWASA